MKKNCKQQHAIRKVAHLFEFMLTIVILMGVFLGALDMIRVLWEAYFVNNHIPVGYDEFNAFLGQIILLVIGIELVIMLTSHSTKALLEVLVFAIAHKIVLLPKSESMGQILLGIIGIACLFAIKKYLIVPDVSEKEKDPQEEDENYLV